MTCTALATGATRRAGAPAGRGWSVVADLTVEAVAAPGRPAGRRGSGVTGTSPSVGGTAL